MFSSNARVKLSCVEGFRNSVIDFNSTQADAKSGIERSFAEAIKEVEEIAREMERLAKECDALYEAIQKKKSEIERTIARIKNQLAHTPKHIEKRSTDKNGKEVVKKEPNPEYARLQSELKAQSARLCHIKDLSWEVYNKCSELRREASYVAMKLGEIRDYNQRASDKLNQIERLAASAARSLDVTVSAIQEYTSIHW